MKLPNEIDQKKMELTPTERNSWEFPNAKNNDLRVVGMRRMMDAGVPIDRQHEL